MLYGMQLNRWKGEASAAYVKPSDNLVEANVTLAIGGSL